jgi:hypothetical protein
MSDETIIMSNNVIVVESQSASGLQPPSLNSNELSEFYDTVFLPIANSKSISDEAINVKLNFGTWIESGDEEKQIVELYESRLISSVSLNE